MWNFLIIMAVFLAIDVVYLSIWTGAFPFRRELDRREVMYISQDVFEIEKHIVLYIEPCMWYVRVK